ncbi:hypothetical protein ABRZ68_12010 [Vibrio vulnificus]|uniref:hypothetical protein n=1 Tax=Vibrio vulnificus TaxID=672 RepID=UPI001A2D5A63|nr:hypothetical protein [Vibrio vulnificus]HAS6222312.1 hypothetical protein [Vibrio vulnificus]
MKKYSNIPKRHLITLGTALVLIGCDTENETSSSSDVAPPSVMAQNATFLTEYTESYTVELAGKVTVSEGASFVISQVQSLNTSPMCAVHEVSATSFTISANSSKVCDYRYKVSLANSAELYGKQSRLESYPEPGSQELDSAVVRVGVSREVAEVEAVQLSAISAVTMIEQQVVVNVYEQLMLQAGYTVPAGFTLSNQVTLPYSAANASSDPINNTITYTPPTGFEGIERILFSYINDTTGEVLLGTLDIAVAHGVNSGLVIEDDIKFEGDVVVDVSTTIDVAPYVTSLDGDPFQLVYVDSFNATTNPASTNLDNTAFNFLTSQFGYHYVSFAVTDHKGAYAMGLMKVAVTDPNSYGSWKGIALRGLWYTRPLSTTEATANGFAYNSSFLDEAYIPAVELSLSRYRNAETQCAKVGRLPTEAEMVSLHNEGVKVKYDWPTSVPYLAMQGATPITIDLSSSGETAGQIGIPGDNDAYLVTCVVGGFSVQGPSTETVANGSNEATLVFNLGVGILTDENTGPEIIPSPDQSITVTANSTNVTIRPNIIVTDELGNATVAVTSKTAEEVQICGTAENTQQQTCTNITFIGDAATAEVVSAYLDTDGWMPEDPTSYTLVASVQDANANPVPRVLVNATKTLDINNANSLTIESSPALTNNLGESNIMVRNVESAPNDQTAVELTHTNTNGILSSVLLHSNWGTWQWANPLRVAFTTQDYYLNSASVPAELACDTLGTGWRLITIAESVEYVTARKANVDQLFDIVNYKTGDPILNELQKLDSYVVWAYDRTVLNDSLAQMVKMDYSRYGKVLHIKHQPFELEGPVSQFIYGKIKNSSPLDTHTGDICSTDYCANWVGPILCVKNIYE